MPINSDDHDGEEEKATNSNCPDFLLRIKMALQGGTTEQTQK